MQVGHDLLRVDAVLRPRKTVVVPADGLGSGPTTLPKRAPKLNEHIARWFKERARRWLAPADRLVSSFNKPPPGSPPMAATSRAAGHFFHRASETVHTFVRDQTHSRSRVGTTVH
ncbi:DUF7831 domain-containing protein [Bradyrhizobium sp. USDA 4503]